MCHKKRRWRERSLFRRSRAGVKLVRDQSWNTSSSNRWCRLDMGSIKGGDDCAGSNDSGKSLRIWNLRNWRSMIPPNGTRGVSYEERMHTCHTSRTIAEHLVQVVFHWLLLAFVDGQTTNSIITPLRRGCRVRLSWLRPRVYSHRENGCGNWCINVSKLRC